MKLTFFGTRGSTPVSGRDYIRWGGNTTCIALETETRLLVVDCGTGLQAMQRALFDSGRYQAADIFITHLHWDHIQGVAFFGPFFSPAHHFTLYSEERYGFPFQKYLDDIMNSPMFPIMADAFHAALSYRTVTCGESFQVGDVQVDTVRLKHPNICTGYRFTHQGRSVCIVGDYEHGGDSPDDFASGADVIVYDGQYTDEEYPAKAGWGHSTWREGCALAKRCGAKKLILTHHDPSRTDDMLDELEWQARAEFPGASFAWDGMTLEV